MTQEQNPERVKKLTIALLDAVKAHYADPPKGRIKVFEAMNALASVSAAVIAGGKRDGSIALSWFNEALTNELASYNEKAGAKGAGEEGSGGTANGAE